MSVPVPNPYILIVDDFSDGREMLAEYLGFRGHTVRQATDGAAALTMAREQVPALVLLDLAMAGVDGYEVARQLKADATTRSALIVAVTARVSVPDESRARAAGCDGFVAKPYNLTALADAIGSIMADGRKGLRRLNASTPGGTPAPSTTARKLSRP